MNQLQHEQYCAKKLFAKLSDGLVTYDHVSNYQELLNKVLK